MAFKQTQGLTVTEPQDSAVASLGLLAGSVIAALQVTIASLTVYHVTVKKMASQPTSATQTQGGVFASLLGCEAGVWKVPTRRRLPLS